MGRNEGLGYKIFTIFNICFMLLIIVVMAFPYLHVLAKAFNDGVDAASGGIVLFPRKFSIENFKVIILDKEIWNSFVISVVRVIIAVILTLLVQFGAAYTLSREQFHGKGFILILFTLPMFIMAGQIPLYVLYSKIHLLNNFWVYILPLLFSFYNIVIIRTFIQTTIPKSLEESAFIDGANEVIVFFKIILPLTKPILATIALWVMVQHWNDYTTTLLYVRKSSLYTLQYRMMELIKESERLQKMIAAAIESGQIVDESAVPTSDSLVSAQIIFTTIPIICVYPFLQKYFIKGIVMGSVKG